MRRVGYILFLSFMLILASCSKDTDSVNPVIEVLSPFQNQVFQIPAEIHVVAQVKDDINIEYIKVSLLDDSYNPVLPDIIYYPASRSFSLDLKYPVDDILLESGNYLMQIKAYDGINTTRSFINLYLDEVQKKLEKIIGIVTNGDKIFIRSIDFTSISTLIEFPDDYAASALNSKFQQLYFAGRNTINLQAFDIKTQTVSWEEEPMIQLPFHHPRCLSIDDKLLFVSFQKGIIRAYDHLELIKFDTPITDVAEPARIHRHEEIVIADLKERSGHRRFIMTYYFASGDRKDSLLSNVEVVEFISKNSDFVYVIGNQSSGGYLGIYDVLKNKLSAFRDFQGGVIFSATVIDEDNFLIGSEGGVYWYNGSNNSLSPWLPGVLGFVIRFDELSGQVFISTGVEIAVYNFPNGILSHNMPVGDSIINLHLLYNR
ncbi:MAG: hypothetical protein KAG99_04140 [Bacteroidales bacterium]|nr:hypothetical protein [Bacteroidales bacterium]